MLLKGDKGWLIPPHRKHNTFLNLHENLKSVSILRITTDYDTTNLYPEEALGLKFLKEILSDNVSNVNTINYMIKMKKYILTQDNLLENVKKLPLAEVRPVTIDSVFPIDLIFTDRDKAKKYRKFILDIRTWFLKPFHMIDINELYEKYTEFKIKKVFK